MVFYSLVTNGELPVPRMPQKPGESIHAPELMRRGFKKVPDIALSRAQKSGLPPSWSSDGARTNAVDETGQNWRASGVVSLNDLGFNDLSRQHRKAMERMQREMMEHPSQTGKTH